MLLQPLEGKLIYQLSEPLWIGSNHLINHLTSFNKQESRHARDFELLSSSLVRVDVYFQELSPGPVLVRQVLVDRGNLLTRTAPCRREVDYGQFVLKGRGLKPRL